jgi:hypothetical protein
MIVVVGEVTAEPFTASYHREQRIVIESETEFVALDVPFPVSDSIVVVSNDVPMMRDLDFVFDPRTNLIQFDPPIPVGTNLVITYDTIPLRLHRESSVDIFGLTVLPRRPDSATGRAVTPDRLRMPESSSLHVSGAKTFAVSAGNNRSFAPDQSLRLNVDGEIAPGVSVTAMLTDQQTPIQPEGTTEELDRLDDVLIRLTATRFSASLGNDEARLDANELVLSPVRMQGVQASGDFGRGDAQFIVALPRGRSESLTLVGIEGQNAYRLTTGNRFVAVVAGSERVWLNGVEMRRGESNDYVIRDYGDPIVEFTSKHLITRDDVIRVDYEYSPEGEGWRRSLYAVRGGVHRRDDRVRMGISYASETDDANRPLDSLSKNDLNALRRGDETSDDGRSLAPPIRRDVIGVDGSLMLSGRSQIRGVWALHRFDRNTLFLGESPSESVAWRFAANAQSDVFQFEGDTSRFGASFQPVGSSESGRTVSGYATQFESDSYGDALLGTGFARSDTGATPAEERYDARIRWQPVQDVTLGGRLGMSRTDYADDSRNRDQRDWNADIAVRHKGMPEVRNELRRNRTLTGGRPDYSKTQDDWRVAYRLWRIQTAYTNRRFLAEDLNVADGSNRNLRRWEQTFRFTLASGELLSASVRYERERDQNKETQVDVTNAVVGFSDWRLANRARTTALDLGVRTGSWGDITSTFARRTLAQLGQEGNALRTTLADVQMNVAPLRRAVSGGLRFSVDKRLSSRREEVFTNVVLVDGVPVQIQKGQGAYVKVDDYHYEEDAEEGDYIRIVRTVGDTPVTVAEGQFRFRLEPVRWFAETASIYTRALNTMTLDGRWNISEERDDADFGELLRLDNYRSERTVYGQVVSYVLLRVEPSSHLSVEMESNGNDSLNRRLNSQSRWTALDSHRARFRWAVTKRWTLEASAERRLSDERLERVIAATDAVTDGPDTALISLMHRDERESAVGVRYQPTPQWNVGAKWLDESERATENAQRSADAHTRTRGAEFQSAWLLPGRGRAEASYRLVDGTIRGAALPQTIYRFYEGFSHELRVRSDVRIRSFTDLTFRLNYRMLATRTEPTEHRADLELVAEL